MAAWSSPVPLPRNSSTADWDAHRSKTLIRPGSSNVRRDREVEAAGRTAGLRDDVRAIGQIVVAHLFVDDQMPRDDHHGVPLLSSSHYN